jgi:hypothetical protein
MKKLKLTINGEVKTFDLPENGEYKCEVEESYVPKVGDCVRVQIHPYNDFYWFKITKVTNKNAYFKQGVHTYLYLKKEINNLDVIKIESFIYINDERIYTQITPEELKAKYAEAGYDWDYETDTIKPLKWMPKPGDYAWYLNNLFKSWRFIFEGNGGFEKDLLDKGLLFPTEEECQKFADHCMKYINKNK